MNGAVIIEKFTNLVGDELDPDFALQLVNDAKNSIESELQLEITKKLDSTDSVSAGQNSTTARNLPADFFLPLTIYVGTQEVSPIPFEKQIFFKDNNGRYWIDLANDQYHLCGNQGSAQPVYFFYQYETPDIATGTSPVWPTRFHSLIPYEMARKYFAIDQGEKSRSWLPEHQAFYMELKRQMIDWDAKLKLNAMDNSAFLDTSPYPSENRINS